MFYAILERAVDDRRPAIARARIHEQLTARERAAIVAVWICSLLCAGDDVIREDDTDARDDDDNDDDVSVL